MKLVGGPYRADGDPRRGARLRWILAGLASAAALALMTWWTVTHPAWHHELVRLYRDPRYLHDQLGAWGVLAPVAFVAIQALQVVVSPIPGDVTGLLGGYVFGQWLGFAYSTVGLTVGSLLAFWIGRRFGTPFVRRLVDERVWSQIAFVVEAEATVVCLVIFTIPGLPKDIACYLFGLSPMPFWLFAIVSTVGRMPGTWALSAQGAKAASGQYVELLVLTAVVAAIAIPLYHYRAAILARFGPTATTPGAGRAERS